jgi:hypothetical protein
MKQAYREWPCWCHQCALESLLMLGGRQQNKFQRSETAEQVPKVKDSRTSSKHCANQIPLPTTAPGKGKATISGTLDNFFWKTRMRWGHRVLVADNVAAEVSMPYMITPRDHGSSAARVFMCPLSRVNKPMLKVTGTEVCSPPPALELWAWLLYLSALCIPSTKVIDRYQVSIYYLILFTNPRIWTPLGKPPD